MRAVKKSNEIDAATKMVDEKPTNGLLGSKKTDKVDHLVSVEVKREAAENRKFSLFEQIETNRSQSQLIYIDFITDRKDDMASLFLDNPFSDNAALNAIE